MVVQICCTNNSSLLLHSMHFRFINEFLNECERVITWKLEAVKSCGKERTSHLCKIEKDLDKLEDERKMVKKKLCMICNILSV